MIDWNKVIIASDDDTVQVVCGKSIFFAVSRAAGIDRVQKTSTSGLVDTYTIYRTDGTVAGTFTVTNGRVAEIHICSSYEYDSQTLIPTIANPQTNTFYLVPSGTGNDMYDEWIYVNNAWEKFGSASVDLSQYYTKTQTDELLNTKANTNDLGSMAFEDDAPTDNVEYVRKNGEWAVSSGGGGSGGQAVWGAIAGTLSQQTDLQNALNAKADQSSTYTKNEVNNLLDGKQDELTFDNTPTENSNNPVKSGGIKTALDAKADNTSVYTKTEADTLLADKANTADLGDLAILDNVDFATQVTNKPTAYPPAIHNHDDRYYTETEVDTFVDDLQDQIDAINKFSIHICSSTEYDSVTHIPTVTNPQDNTFYLVPNGTSNDMYDEWIYTNNAWEKFGSARIDISQYYTKTQTDNLLSVKANESIVANEWSNIKAYNIGDIVIYNHELYKFTENVAPKVEPITVKVIHGKTAYYKDELLVYSDVIYKVLAGSISYYGSDSSAPDAIQTWLNNGKIEIVDVKEYTSGETYQVGDIVKIGNEYYIVTVAGIPTEWNPSVVSKINIIEAIGDIYTFDTTPTAGSNNPVTSGGIKTALDAKQNTLPSYDSTPTANSTNIVTSGGVKAALDAKQNTLTFDTTPTANSINPVQSGGIKTALDAKQNTLTFDSTPTSGSTKPVTSGGVKTALDTKQNTLTFDSTPTAGSNNPVKSSGILSAINSAINNQHKIYSAITELGFSQSSYPKLKAVTDAMPEGSIGMFKKAEIDITDYDNYENIRNLVIFRNASHGIIVLGFSYFDDSHDMENYDYGLYYANYDPEWGYFWGFRKANQDPILYYENQSVYVTSNSTIIRIPYGSSLDYNISPDTIVLNCTFANPANITSDVSWTSYAGYILFTGTCTAATTANVTLGQKGN